MAAIDILTTYNLSRKFGGIHAVNNVSFNLPKGEIRALIGPNGAGKTTFVSLLCGRVLADNGEVFFNGEEITHMPIHKRIAKGIGYTFQITSIFSRLSLYENVSLAIHPRISNKLQKNSPHEIDNQINQALDKVGLLDRAQHIGADMSYGHQRLLEIAMGLAQKPKLLILDEPTQGLAKSEIDQFNTLLRSIIEETTILLIEHNMDVVMQLADQITVLNFGKILAEGTPQEIHANSEVQAAYLGKNDA